MSVNHSGITTLKLEKREFAIEVIIDVTVVVLNVRKDSFTFTIKQSLPDFPHLKLPPCEQSVASERSTQNFMGVRLRGSYEEGGGGIHD